MTRHGSTHLAKKIGVATNSAGRDFFRRTTSPARSRSRTRDTPAPRRDHALPPAPCRAAHCLAPTPLQPFRRTHGRAKPHAHSTGDLKTAPPAKVSASPKRRIALPSASSTSPSSQQHRAARRRLGAARPRRQQVQCRGWPHIPGCIPLPGL